MRPPLFRLSSDISPGVVRASELFVSDYNPPRPTTHRSVRDGWCARRRFGGSFNCGMQCFRARATTFPAASISSLADLGVTFDQTGTASFNAGALSSLSSSQVKRGFQLPGLGEHGPRRPCHLVQRDKRPGHGRPCKRDQRMEHRESNADYKASAMQPAQVNTMQIAPVEEQTTGSGGRSSRGIAIATESPDF